MPQELKHYINGKWISSKDDDFCEILNPATEEVIARAPRADQILTKQAIDDAKEAFAFGQWANQSAKVRADVLRDIAKGIEDQQEELRDLEVKNNGKTLAEAESDVIESVRTFRYYADLIEKQEEESFQVMEEVETIIVQEPLGVAGLIVPWNFPLLMSVWKIAPALAAGNSIVLKPAEITPLTAVKLFEIFDETSLPKGVAHLVMGKGSVVGQTIAESKNVDIVSFTGSTAVGRHIMQAATTNMKKVSLELGGKSPNIIFDNADLKTAVDYALFGIFMGAGQVCSSGSRILVQEGLYDQFVAAFLEEAKKIKVGPGADPNSDMGAIVSEHHLESILQYIDHGIKEGAHLALGGKRLNKKGFFIEPTVFTEVKQSMKIVQEEIFGPVVTIQSFKDEEEAIELANDTDYGLAGAVFSSDEAQAFRVIKKIRAGITWINNYHLTPVQAPWGGYKQSGIGRSLGPYGLLEYQEMKQINVHLNPKPMSWRS